MVEAEVLPVTVQTDRWTDRQTGSGQTVVLVSRAAQPFSGTLTAAQAHTAKKKGSINLVYCFSGSRRGQTIQNVI